MKLYRPLRKPSFLAYSSIIQSQSVHTTDIALHCTISQLTFSSRGTSTEGMLCKIIGMHQNACNNEVKERAPTLHDIG